MNKVKAIVRDLDVWGNVQDGWEVNDSWPIGQIEFDIDSEQSILDALIEMQILRSDTTLKDIIIGGDDISIYIDEIATDIYYGMPIVTLEVITEKKE
jgi:hypothetical protein